MASCHQLRYVVSLHCTRHAILQPLYSARHSSTFSRASSRAQNLSHIVLGLITHCRQKVITLCSELIAVHATVGHLAAPPGDERERPSLSQGKDNTMATFYDDWLAAGERIQEEFRRSPMIAHDRNIPWVSTRQDAKVKLMVANE